MVPFSEWRPSVRGRRGRLGVSCRKRRNRTAVCPLGQWFALNRPGLPVDICNGRNHRMERADERYMGWHFGRGKRKRGHGGAIRLDRRLCRWKRNSFVLVEDQRFLEDRGRLGGVSGGRRAHGIHQIRGDGMGPGRTSDFRNRAALVALAMRTSFFLLLEAYRRHRSCFLGPRSVFRPV